MKKFTITTTTGLVEVEAEYFRVADGVLTFRNPPRGNQSFPTAVHTFAHGHWREVTEGQEIIEPRRACGPRQLDLDNEV